MANKVQKGRFTARMEGDFVVFIIGMRFNKLWKVHKWWGPFLAMPRMLRELQSHPDKGLLGARLAVSGRTVNVVQYWRSFEHLEAFAKSSDDVHLPAWRAFNKKVGVGGDVGLYHESYRVAANNFECVYANVPVMGLAAAGQHVAIGRRSDAARQRMGVAVEA